MGESIKIYGPVGTRALRVLWLLNELDVPYESVNLDYQNGEHRGEAFLKINPMGKAPALVTKDITLFESAAICNYLADKYKEKGLIPDAGTIERGYYDQWAYFSVNEIEGSIWTIAKHTWVYSKENRSETAKTMAAKELKRGLKCLETHLAGNAYLLGKDFYAVDVILGYALQWAAGVDDSLGDFPVVTKYLDSLTSRPAFPAS